MKLNENDKANVLQIALNSLDCGEIDLLTEFFFRKFSKNLLDLIYLNFEYEHKRIVDIFETADIRKIKKLLSEDNVSYIMRECLGVESNLIALQLQLIEKLNIPENIRNIPIEKHAKMLSDLDEH